MELDEFELAAAVRRPHHHDLRSDAVEPDDLVHLLALDQPAALALESQIEEERRRSVKVIDNNTHMIEARQLHIIHSLDVQLY